MEKGEGIFHIRRDKRIIKRNYLESNSSKRLNSLPSITILITSSYKSDYENSLKNLLSTHWIRFNFQISFCLLTFFSFLFSTRSVRSTFDYRSHHHEQSRLRIVIEIVSNRGIRLIPRDCGSGHFSASLNLFT